jgi:hypothetical protein
MIIKGSLNYTTSGRRRNSVSQRNKFKSKGKYEPSKVFRRETPHYPSRTSDVQVATLKDNSELIEISSKFTIAPAYNKGAYQVISPENIKYIGKK